MISFELRKFTRLSVKFRKSGAFNWRLKFSVRFTLSVSCPCRLSEFALTTASAGMTRRPIRLFLRQALPLGLTQRGCQWELGFVRRRQRARRCRNFEFMESQSRFALGSYSDRRVRFGWRTGFKRLCRFVTQASAFSIPPESCEQPEQILSAITDSTKWRSAKLIPSAFRQKAVRLRRRLFM